MCIEIFPNNPNIIELINTLSNVLLMVANIAFVYIVCKSEKRNATLMIKNNELTERNTVIQEEFLKFQKETREKDELKELEKTKTLEQKQKEDEEKQKKVFHVDGQLINKILDSTTYIEALLNLENFLDRDLSFEMFCNNKKFNYTVVVLAKSKMEVIPVLLKLDAKEIKVRCIELNKTKRFSINRLPQTEFPELTEIVDEN